MRIVQVVTESSLLLRAFYENNPHLAAAEYDEQVKALVEDGLGGSRLLADELRALGYDAHAFFANDPRSQQAWARRHGMHAVDSAAWSQEILARQIALLRPDILLVDDPVLLDSRFVRSLDRKPPLVVGWPGAVPAGGADWSEVDLLLAHPDLPREALGKAGPKAVETFLPGCRTRFVELARRMDAFEARHDVVFIGERWNEAVRMAAKASMGGKFFSCALFLPDRDPDRGEDLPPEMAVLNRGARWGRDACASLKMGRMALHVEGAGGPSAFDIAATGALLLAERRPYLAQCFEEGAEIETFGSPGEALEKIMYFGKHADELKAIARRGRERCLLDHTARRRAERLGALLSERLAGSGAGRGKQSEPIRSPLTGSTNVEIVESIPARILVDGYRKLGIDARKYFECVPVLDVYRCLDTGIQFHHPCLEGDAQLYRDLERLPWYYMDWKWEHRYAASLISPGAKVLEIGCARGSFLERLGARGCETAGLEFNPSAAAAARARNLDVRQESIEEHARRHPGEYDVVCAFQVVEHVAGLRSFLQASVDAVKPGGRMIISMPNSDSTIFRWDRFHTLNRPPHHVTLWGLSPLLSLARLFPLVVEDVAYEPVQEYHMAWFHDVFRTELVKRYGEEGRAMLARLGEDSAKVAELFFKDIPSHTILACYVKK